METFKRVLGFVLGGAVLGLVFSTLIGSSFIPWYFQPGGGTTLAQCSCLDVSKGTLDMVIRWQAVGAGIGAIAGAVVGFLVHRRKPKAPSSASPAAPTPSEPPAP